MAVQRILATAKHQENGAYVARCPDRSRVFSGGWCSGALGLKGRSPIGFVLQIIFLLSLVVVPEAMAKSNDHKFQNRHRSVPLTVVVQGGGTVTSKPEGISCSEGRCQGEFPRGTVVRLRASAVDGMEFSQWRGACGGSRGCKVRLRRPKTVLASFKAPLPVPLTVYVRGEGKVTSTPEGISCTAGKCRGEFARGTVVRLHADPGDGHIFKKWRGACWGSKGCKVKLKRPRNVLAQFRIPRLMPLRVMVKGEGSITSSPEGLECREHVCFGKFPEKSYVTLTAVPREGQSFKRWRGACRGSETCTVKLRRPRTVLAKFTNTPPPPPEEVVLSLSMKGKGKVTSSPEGIECTTESCKGGFPVGTIVTLKPEAGEGHVFSEWSGACKGNEECKVTMNEPAEVNANFVLIPKETLTVMIAGEGVVFSDPDGIECKTETCVAEYPQGSPVTLIAKPGEGQLFGKWTGDCSSSESTCKLTLSKSMSVKAEFQAVPKIALTLNIVGLGEVISDPEGLECEAGTCVGQFPQGTEVVLQPKPGENQVFGEWAGGCTGSEGCKVTLNAPVVITATFTPPPPPPNVDLSVTVVGDGSVVITPVNLTCTTGTCTNPIPTGTIVTISAIPNTGQSFSGWTGACSGIGSCALTVTAATAATATFVPSTPGGTTNADAIRFLEQSTWGPNPTSIAHLQSIGKTAFLAEQFNATPSTYPDPVDDSSSLGPLQDQWFHNVFHGQDQLRQRVAFALSQLFVVSANALGRDDQMIPYQRIMLNNAFGNFYDLMRDVTLSPAMGLYLDMVNNDKTDPGSGLNPNENYARELLQLFSVGLNVLSPDGSEVLDTNGQPIPTYDQDVVINLSRVFTGWTYPTRPGETPRWRNPSHFDGPMEAIEEHHDTEQKLLMNGFVIPAGGTAQEDLDAALTHIFEHQNVGPFVATRLIRNLVTSNPSPEYIQRVAAVFNDDGSGVRGNMQAVITAILMDAEAATVVPNGSHLREPILYAMALLRALEADVELDNPLYTRTRDLGQTLFSPPSVFNFFSPLYKIPGTNLFGPEYQIHTLTNVIARANFVNRVVTNGLGGGTTVDLSRFEAVAADAGQLVAEVERALLHENLSDAERQSIITAVSVSSNSTTRARTAVYLVATSAKYQVQH
ncbi:DUF1800 family protein [Candidatus Nitronereus thalassa]|uniref:DUF1800 family protein n=1 Tax=Candidatus Nitronereus thalassa TaxID=3020898 RepID=A0ABU3KC91_9BACT|nr:DUF1800 family protein [Candidatus Nitronereus thalassa]MDT7044129.1 DUF1800 family protein [Candidatus Nitronereus thalassa]